MESPLEGVTVLELANWVAAPSCAALMADMGARVIKVEPLSGDGMRGKLRQPNAPPDAAALDYPFQLDNRGKQSIAVDLGDHAGAALVRDLAGDADVLITNLLPGRLERYGLSPDQLTADHPALVYAVVTGYGTSGTERDRGGFDLTAFFARSGIMSLIGEPDAPPPAFRPGQGDHPTGLALLVAVLAALRVRDATGAGQIVETSLLQVGTWSIGCDVQTALIDGEQPRRVSHTETFSPMNTQYRCADGVWINISAQDQRLWEPLCEAIGRQDLAADRYATAKDRFRHRRELIAQLAQTFASAPADHWGPLLEGTGIIWERVATLAELIADPQARAIGVFEQVEHPRAGTFETLGAPFRLHGSPVAVRGPAPAIGEHTDEVLHAAGIDADGVEALRRAGVIRSA